MEFFSFDLVSFIKATGVLGVAAIIFIESGLLVGFFLPGDSLLFTAGFLASQHVIPLIPLLVFSFAGAVLGDNLGYAIGKRLGPRLFTKNESFFFRRDHVEKTKAYFDRYGPKTILLARFIPVVRTFAPVMAGVGAMRYRTFVAYNLAGGFLWSVCLPILGYALGSTIPDVDRYLIPIIIAIILASVLPPLREYWRYSGIKRSS
ncbi:VTT domain-containing protein [Candidatus Uhrbacteria bacterium]|nr:VTT domain-containing protein [Candidatus Uhrbacteria bacterium]